MNSKTITGSREDLLDRSSPLPAYQQIANDLIQRIIQKEWQMEDKLPSETELAAEYGVSRVTLRQALSNLEKDQIIEKFQGKGAYVKNNPRQLVNDLVFPSLDVTGSYVNPIRSKVLSISGTLPPNHFVQEGLKVGTEEQLTYVERIFYYQNRPAGVNHIWFKESDVPGFAEDKLMDGSVSKTLKFLYHYEITEIENYIEAVRLDAVTAGLLNTVYDALGLKIDSQYVLADERPVEYSSTIWLGEFTRFHYKVCK